ncbi:hypothetical protein [Herbidospora cretacea]|uniref:hypothetical protein n=1 Tax=Herbidospora cretacea TaxID=28444 RepID=UPI0012F75119|nr:hypothetical protein [Herbidospora cretacea]
MSDSGDSGSRTAVPAPLEVRIGRAAVIAFALFLMARTVAHYVQDPPVRAIPAVILTVAVIALYVWSGYLGRSRHRWRFVAASAVIVYLPLPLLGAWWAGAGIFLAATVLGFLSRWYALPAFGLVLLLELVKSLALGDDLMTALSWILTVAVAAVPLAALTHFAETARVLYETRAELVAAEVAAQRARAMGELEGILGSRLNAIAQQGFRILSDGDGNTEILRKQLHGIHDIAVEAQREMREFAHRVQQ